MIPSFLDSRMGRAGLLTALFAAAFVALVWMSGPRVSAEAKAQEALASCAEASDPAPCYEERIPNLYPELTVPQIFDIVREVRRADSRYQFCHVLAHKLGERVVAEDPQEWMHAIALNPIDGMCSNGFVHGVTTGRFRAEVLSPETIEQFIGDFTAACAPRADWSPNDLDRAICYHGLGHLYDFITNADIPAALVLCSRTAPAGYERMCIEGVFMQIYQPLEPDDFALIEQMEDKPSTTTVRRYCAGYEKDEYEGACLRESWPYFADSIRDGSYVGKFCSGQPNEEQTLACYQGATSIIGRMSLDDPKKAAAACSKLPQERQGLCFSYSAETVIQEDRNDASQAVALCNVASGKERDTCFAHLLDHADFVFGKNKSQYGGLCKALPAPWGAQCEAQLKAQNS